MINLKNLRHTLVLTTAILSSSIFEIQAMDPRNELPLPAAIQVKPALGAAAENQNEEFALHLLTSGDGINFYQLPPEESKETIESWQKISAISPIEMFTNEDQLFCYRTLPGEESLLNAEQTTTELEKLLNICREVRAQQAQAHEKDINEANSFVGKEEAQQRDATALIHRERQALEELTKQREAAAAQFALIQQKQEEERRKLEEMREQAFAAETERLRLQEFLRQQEAEREASAAQQAAAAAEQLRQQEEANQAAAQLLQQVMGGRPPERVQHNIDTELTRGIQGLNNVLSGRSWNFGRKDKKKHKHK